MPDRKRKKDAGATGQSPFRDLGKIVRDAGFKLDRPEPVKAAKPAPPPPREEPDETVFGRAMQGVVRASWRHDPLPSEVPAPSVPNGTDTEAENLRLMQAAVEGVPELPVSEHPEYIEGWVGVAGKRFLPNLRTGMYSIQAQIDLHGLSRDAAREAVEEFVFRMSRFRSCCVKIIHGRGINSPTDRAVLKENLQRWLSSRRLGRHVVAYASAQMNDGGVGAVYVLLSSRS